jgi:hypothetical protein
MLICNNTGKFKKIKFRRSTFLMENGSQYFENELLKSPKSKKMKNSIIFKMESKSENQTLIKKLTLMLSKTNNLEDTRVKQGVIPYPRDGHTANLYENSMIVFGGDRNKFPFNDLFAFKF